MILYRVQVSDFLGADKVRADPVMVSPYNYRNCIRASTQLGGRKVFSNESAEFDTIGRTVSLQLQYIG